LKGVAAGRKGVIGLAVVKKYGRLAFAYNELRTVFLFSGAVFRDPVYQLFSRFIKPFDDFHKNDIVFPHCVYPP